MCRPASHHRHHRARSAASAPAVAPPAHRAPDVDPDLRVGDREREATAAELREHAAAGRLSVGELEERLGAALTARTGRALRAPLADLPPLAGAPAPGPQRRARREPLGPVVGPWLAVSLLLIAIWAFSGGGAFWPVWPILGWGIAVALRALNAVRGPGVPTSTP